MVDQKKNAPVEVLRDGALKATIWRNEGEKGSFFSTTLSKTFELNGAPKDGYSLNRSDLLGISELARQAYHCMGKHWNDLKQEEASSEEGDNEPAPQ